ncbi:recombinase XerC [Collibacillus ludicampi]|uniref:Recombinase XerC n=1 Tax=Collibacillus ludicampi TaxID=2771369 RepID=A0AAV4LHW2_9BACL|nr:tyrosine-type recombinase/integrase [Collibacillus ludicampi]GIM47022.1 recombinase XerC [Collibacillus ludicampi]
MLKRYLQVLEATGKSPQTIRTYRQQLHKFFEWLQSNGGDPNEITPIDVVEYRSHLQEKALKPASINTALSSIDAYGKWMVEEGIWEYNPAAKVRRVEQVQEPPKWLKKSEKYRVIRAAMKEKDKRNTAIILTFLMAGLRASELINLKPEDVLIGQRKGSIIVRAGKGNKRRVVPIPNDLRVCLGEYLVEHHATGEWLFDSQRGEKLTYIGVYQLCAAIGKKAGVEGLTPHVLRHTYCHDLVSKGVGLETVAKLAGHAKLETTLIYTQPGEDELQKAVERLSFT